jgi:hypothetical protein
MNQETETNNQETKLIVKCKKCIYRVPVHRNGRNFYKCDQPEQEHGWRLGYGGTGCPNFTPGTKVGA